MFQDTDDLRIEGLRPLIPPAILMEELPLTDAAAKTVVDGRAGADGIVKGSDDRLMVVVGPCSIHDVDAALEYANRLKPLANQYIDDLLIVMRVYFEKPRTTIGWKGLINDPMLDNSFEINTGLRTARRLLCELADLGLPTGTEFLDTISPQFIADLISWGAIGARTTESQIHRELASGLSMPVGFKNGTDGNVKIAIDAIGAACNSHHFLSVTKQGISAIVSTKGNDACHLILRGSGSGPNYDAEAVKSASESLDKADVNPRIMVDCSHGNSRKDHRNQPSVAAALCEQIAGGTKVITGVMIESHLVEGNQKHEGSDGLTYGQSITDACISWETTVPVLEDFANAVRARRRS
ncbi:MAG: 3-deoxy-7-phosphoheptulonate synthase [Pseudomonadota bacterium]